MVDKKINEKDAFELKKIYNHYLDKRCVIMQNTLFIVEVYHSDIISRKTVSREQITKPKNNVAKKLWKTIFV